MPGVDLDLSDAETRRRLLLDRAAPPVIQPEEEDRLIDYVIAEHNRWPIFREYPRPGIVLRFIRATRETGRRVRDAGRVLSGRADVEEIDR